MEGGWSTQYWASLDLKYKARLIIEAGKAGVWSVTRDADNQKYPYPEFESDGKLKVKREASNGRYGAYITGDKGDKPGGGGTGWWNTFGTDSGMLGRMEQGTESILPPRPFMVC